MTKLTLAVLPATLLVSACAGTDAKIDARPEQFARPDSLQAALEDPIIDCQTAAADCSDHAADFDARVACNDTLAQCLRGAASQAQNVAVRVEACRDDARVCLQNGNDADACRTGYDACTDAALHSGAADAGGAVLDAGALSVDAGTFDPGLPGLDAGPIDSLPAPVQCTIELRLCVTLDITSAAQCADTARICLQLP